MPRSGRRRFLGLVVGGATAALQGARAAEAQAPPKVPLDETDARRRGLAAALRELNAKAGLGVTAEDLHRAEAYVTGAFLEVETKLRSLPLPEGLDLPLAFRARRRP
jgi:hypothetical protein